jgi:hemerythrin superfamily protein
MNAITLLKNDHKAVEQLFTKYETLGDKATRQKRRIADQIVKALSVHAVIEEQLLYPTVRAEVPEQADLALEALEEHHVVKWLLEELRTLPADHERFAPKMKVLLELVRKHLQEEEKEMFPALRRAVPGARLVELGDQMIRAKKRAPTRPHPRAPDSPPANLVAGPIAGALDRASDALRSLAGRAARRRQAGVDADTGAGSLH